MTRLQALIVSVILTALALQTALAAPSLSIAPLKLLLSPRDKTVSLTLTNSGDSPITLTVQVRRWMQGGGAEQLNPTRDLVAAPAQFTLKPGGRQVVRLARLTLPSVTESAYRVLLTEVPSGRAAGLQTVLQLSVPLFEGVIDGAPRLEAIREGDRLIVRNTGDRHVRLANLEFRDSAGWRPLGLVYVLPGQFRSFPAPGVLELRYAHEDTLAPVALPLR